MHRRPTHSSFPTSGRRLRFGFIACLIWLICVAGTVVSESSSGESRGWSWRTNRRQVSDSGNPQGQQAQNAEGFADGWDERGRTETGYEEQYYHPRDADMGLPFDDTREFRDSEPLFGGERYPYQSAGSTGPFHDRQAQQLSRRGPPPPSRPPPPPGSFASQRNRKDDTVDNSFGNAPRDNTSFGSPKDSSYAPIHYNFPAEAKMSPDGDDEWAPLPEASLSDGHEGEEDAQNEFSSARRDVVTRFTATRRGKATLLLSSGSIGATCGVYLGKSLINSPRPLAEIGFGVAVFASLLRNSYGQLSQAVGMALILALQRTSSIRSRYPTWRHVKASVGVGERRLGKFLKPGSQQRNIQQQQQNESVDSLVRVSSSTSLSRRDSSSVFPSVVNILKAQALREHVESFQQDHSEKAELMQVLPPGYDWSQAIREMANRRSRAFLLLDLALIVHTLVGWRQQILKQVPKVRFLYNTQYNADPQLLKLLIRSDVGLVCTSRWDIQKCQEAAAATTESERGKARCRLYDSTCSLGKPDGFLRQLVLESDADTIAVDSAREIHRVIQALDRMRQRSRYGMQSKLQRNIQFILRLKTNETLSNWTALIEEAFQATQNVKSYLAGISVDVATVDMEDEAFPHFRSRVEEVLRLIRSLHRDESTISLRVDLTGFSSIDESKRSDIFEWWNQLCQLDYIDSITVDISHLLVSPAGALSTRIVGVREVVTTSEPFETHMHYYIDDGCYGSLYNHDSTPIPLLSVANESDGRKMDEGREVQIYTSTIWGPTCDGLDRVCKDIPLPKLKRDNWLVFPNLGCSAGEGLGTAFNGFSPPDTAYCVLGYFRGEPPTKPKI